MSSSLMIRTAAMAAILVAAPAAASAKSIAFDASAKDGLVIIEAEPARILRPGGSYNLETARYADGLLDTGSFKGGWVNFKKMGKNQPERRYYVARAAAGDYAISAVSHKATWYACFNGGTVSYTVRPGQVTFIGRIDPTPSLQDIALSLPSMASNHKIHYLLDHPRPRITPPDQLPGWRESLAAYLAANQPQVQAPVEPAELKPAAFQSGWTLFGQPACYGYFRKTAASKKAGDAAAAQTEAPSPDPAPSSATP